MPLQKVSRLDQKHAYINDAKCMKSNSSLSAKASKGSKYTRLVNFICTLLKQQNTSPILITDNPPPISTDSVKFWKIPCVGTGQSLSSTEIVYMRLPEPCLIEALLMRDIGSLVEVVSFQNHYMNSMAKKFRGQITELLCEIFPGCDIVEAGSSSRKTNAMPISDLDVVCGIPSNYKGKKNCFETSREKLCKNLREKYPTWNLKSKEIAIGIESSANYTGENDAPLLPYKLYADIVLKSTKDIAAIEVAKRRRNILSELPQSALDAARILKVILKCKIWPSVEHRPPSYMVDVVIRYMWLYGIPQICTREGKDPRPYIHDERKCYMFWKSIVTNVGIDDKCLHCRKKIIAGYWECPRCGTFVCSKHCSDRLTEKLQTRSRRQKIRYPFPKEAAQTFRKVPASEYSRFGNRQWLNPTEWGIIHEKDSTFNYIVAFFHFGAYLEKMKIIFKEGNPRRHFDTQHIQDPANPELNIIDRFKPNSFINFCHTMIDDSSKGFYDMTFFLQMRQAFYNPFNAIFQEGLKTTVFLCVPIHELIFECVVDPRWSYQKLLSMHGATQKEDCPNVLFWEHSNSVFADHRGIVQDNAVSLLSRGVSFGHAIYLLHKEYYNFGNFSSGQQICSDLITHIKDSINPSEIRKPRYHWTMCNPHHPKVLVDNQTGAKCYFSPSLNMIRNLGPDFDSNPMNFPKSYRPKVLNGLEWKYLDDVYADDGRLKNDRPGSNKKYFHTSLNTTFGGNPNTIPDALIEAFMKISHSTS